MSDFYEVISSRYLNRYMTVLAKKRVAEVHDFRHLIQKQVRRARLVQGVFILEVEPNDYLLASFNEITRFMGKSLIAYQDFCLQPRLISRSWRYITLYYSLYFFAVLFGRLAGRSIVYIDSAEASSLSSLVSILSGSTHQFSKGNYSLSIDRPDEPLVNRSSVAIRIVPIGNNGSHEATWNQFYDILNGWRESFSGRSLATLTGVRNCLARRSSVFSEARNRINYRGQYTFLELDEKIVFLGPDKRRMSLDELDREVSLITSFSSTDENNVLQVAHTLASFFFALFSTSLSDLHRRQSHPGSHYVKQLARRFEHL